MHANLHLLVSYPKQHQWPFQIQQNALAQVADWDATLEFIKDNDAYDLLEKRVSKSAVRAYIEEDKAVPAGINYGTRIGVNVRKPANKAEDNE